MIIPVSVILIVKNEERRIADCLSRLGDFDQVVIVDSESRDKTASIAQTLGYNVVNFTWNKAYPKKRQWSLDKLTLHNDWILFIDADEIVTQDFVQEVRKLFADGPACCGYFVRSNHVMDGKLLKHGLQNNKLVLLDRTKISFPAIDDLDIPGMGEIEGHYQPVLKPDFRREKIGQINSAIIHDSLDDERGWLFRHQKYARWEAGMNRKKVWPRDPVPHREFAKRFLRQSRLRPQLMFLLSYIFLLGFLDGKAGWKYAIKKKEYYDMVARL